MPTRRLCQVLSASLLSGIALSGTALSGVALTSAAASGDDTVFLKPSASSRAPARITGTITDYTGRELLIRVAGGREQMIPAERVDDIATTYTQKQVDADLLYEEGRFAEANARYREAIREEPRQWVRRQILAQIVWCLRHQRQWEQAAATFLLIVENDATTQYFNALPLAWRPLQLPLSTERQATTWLSDESNPVAQLIAASWLLSGPAELRSEATRTLQQLTTASDSRIAHLAEAQLWRSRVVTADSREIDRLQAAIARMPESLRAGPYHLLGQALARRRQYEDAALAHMRVPILYPRERILAAESLLAASDALRELGADGEARNCLRELVEKYPQSNAASAARSKLE